MPKLVKISLTLLITVIVVLGFALPLNPPNGTWYQQFFPDLGGRIISDITFVDSVNGFAVTRLSSSSDTNFILRSTNSGDSWSIVYRQFTASIAPFNKVKFLNKDTGFVGGNNLLKTTNGGLNWTVLTLPAGAYAEDISILSEDTIWFADHLPFDGGIFRTTNKGISWERKYDATPAPNPDHIYMYNGRIGFMTRSSNFLYKTTDSGNNWYTIPGGVYSDISFIDSLTGWKANPVPPPTMKKTIDGGLSWVEQVLPDGGIILTTNINKFNVLNKDTIWGAGGQVFYGGGRRSGMLFRTTNGGNNWLFQVPDTSFGILGFGKVQFLNKNTGWAYGTTLDSIIVIPTMIHTTNGGDTTFLVGLQQISTEFPDELVLYQNYPNPFNPVTKIKFQMSNKGFVKLIIYEITGKQIAVLVNEELTAGTYETDFAPESMGIHLSSGVYFYKLSIFSATSGRKEVFTETKKMILIK